MESFDHWNEVKKEIAKKSSVHTKEGEIYYASVGHNVGFEQNGKGDKFMRPIVVFKKFGKETILAIPLSTQPKEGRFYFSFSFEPNKISVALLSQIKLLDTKRLYSKIGRIRKDDLVEMKRKFYELTN
ncbi:MAG: hypothetical protein KU38_04395 [Sulfurovum sp. FS08-3]|nr:MAG: hypothetical protein KU38_04395 [Sulfurovum sp. FS08-3]